MCNLTDLKLTIVRNGKAQVLVSIKRWVSSSCLFPSPNHVFPFEKSEGMTLWEAGSLSTLLQVPVYHDTKYSLLLFN